MDKPLIRALVAARIYSGLVTNPMLNRLVDPAAKEAPVHYAELAISHTDELISQLEKKEAAGG